MRESAVLYFITGAIHYGRSAASSPEYGHAFNSPSGERPRQTDLPRAIDFFLVSHKVSPVNHNDPSVLSGDLGRFAKRTICRYAGHATSAPVSLSRNRSLIKVSAASRFRSWNSIASSFHREEKRNKERKKRRQTEWFRAVREMNNHERRARRSSKGQARFAKLGGS